MMELMVLRIVLQQARDGALEPEWRESIPATLSESEAVPSVDNGDVYAHVICAARDLTELPPQQWEPHNGGHWRIALECWFDAMKRCLTVAERADERLREVLPKAEIPSQAAMERDLVVASYRAGLTAGGLDLPDWHQWLIERVDAWPDAQRRVYQLDLMTLEPGYRESIQQLPTYWTGAAR